MEHLCVKEGVRDISILSSLDVITHNGEVHESYQHIRRLKLRWQCLGHMMVT